jgi:hypothetical protein
MGSVLWNSVCYIEFVPYGGNNKDGDRQSNFLDLPKTQMITFQCFKMKYIYSPTQHITWIETVLIWASEYLAELGQNRQESNTVH